MKITMKNIEKNSIVIALIAATLAGIYFGSYRPLVKGQKYIEALSKAGEVRSVEEFRKNFESVLQYPAPVSDDEII